MNAPKGRRPSRGYQVLASQISDPTSTVGADLEETARSTKHPGVTKLSHQISVLWQFRPGFRSNVGLGGCGPPQPKKPRYPNRIAGFLISASVGPSLYRKHTASGVKPSRDAGSRPVRAGVGDGTKGSGCWYLFGQAVESSDPRMRWSAQPPHLLPLLLFTAVLNSVQHGLSERLRLLRVARAASRQFWSEPIRTPGVAWRRVLPRFVYKG